MTTTIGSVKRLLLLLVLGAAAGAATGGDEVLGHWALTLPSGAAGWLGIERTATGLAAHILWGGGSVVPVASVSIEDGTLTITRIHEVQRPGADGKPVQRREVETIRGTVDGDLLRLSTERLGANGRRTGPFAFTGQRLPPLPPRPDLSRVRFGPPRRLFNGTDLTGWRLTDPAAPNGWRADDGALVNRPEPDRPGQPHRRSGNLRTDGEFEDFELCLEFRVPPKGNSGVYLRGLYEIQIADSHGEPPSAHGLGAIYSRIAPVENPARPPGEWQSLRAVLVDRHVTVEINGRVIIDNQPLVGCTGGALSSDVSRPGPVYLQGDHTAVDYRNLVLRPVVGR